MIAITAMVLKYHIPDWVPNGIMVSEMFGRAFIFMAFTLAAAFTEAAVTNFSSVAEMREVFEAKTSPLNFVATGTITRVGKSGKYVILRDETAAIELFNPTTEIPCAGSEVIVSGNFGFNTNGWTWTVPLRLKKTGFHPLPPPIPVALSDLNDPELDLRTVTVTGTVVDAYFDDVDADFDFLLVKDGETLAPVSCPRSADLRELIDAQVRVTGVVRHQTSGSRKYLSPGVYVEDRSDIVTVTPPPDDPFAFPKLERDRFVTPQQIAQCGKRSVTGTVLASWLPNNILLQTDNVPPRSNNSSIMRLSLRSGEPLPSSGRHCICAGYPVTDTYGINLTYARVKEDGKKAQADRQPTPLAAESLFLNRRGDLEFKSDYHHGQLIALTGVVRSLPAGDGKRQLLLDCGTFKVPVDFSICPEAVLDIPLGSTVEATGRCIFETSPWQVTDVRPRISGVLLVMRRAGDLRVIALPPWLTVGKLLVVVALLLLVLLAALVRGIILRRISANRLNERTQLAVELHDSLSQSLAGIAYQIAAARKDGDLPSADRKLATADQMLQSCRVELKNCLFDLRNDTIADQNLNRAIRRTLEKFDDQADISIRFNVSRAPFGDSTVHAVLTIIRELVSNSINHGHAWTIRIAGTVDGDKLMFSVRDDGEGFDPATAPGAADGHFGISGIRERIRRLDGTFEFQPASPRGIKAIITLPVK